MQQMLKFALEELCVRSLVFTFELKAFTRIFGHKECELFSSKWDSLLSLFSSFTYIFYPHWCTELSSTLNTVKCLSNSQAGCQNVEPNPLGKIQMISVSLSFCLSVSPSLRLSVSLRFCLSVSLSLRLSVSLSLCLSVSLSAFKHYYIHVNNSEL
jgi:hypothetical protein